MRTQSGADRQLGATVVRFTLALGGLLTLGIVFADALFAALAPAYRAMLALLLPEFRIVDLTLVTLSDERVIALSADVARPVVVGMLWPAGAQVSSSTLFAHALLPPVLTLAVLAAWPVANLRARLSALGCGVVLTGMVALCDVPMVLAGAVLDVMASSPPYPPPHTHPLVTAMQVLNGGGRLLLAFVAAYAAFVAPTRIQASVIFGSWSRRNVRFSG